MQKKFCVGVGALGLEAWIEEAFRSVALVPGQGLESR